jgi:acyl-CoA thioesterase
MLFADVLQQFKAGQPDQLQIEVPELWGQGRAVFGGMASALALAHLLTALPAIPLRSVSVSFVAPLNAGPATVSRRILRQGKSVIQAIVEISQQDQVALVLLASFGAERPSAYQIHAKSAADLTEKAFVTLPKQGPAPEFTRHFDYQISTGAMPFSGAVGTELGGRIRFAEGENTAVGVPELLALVDAWPPVSLMLLQQPAPASSLTWTIEFIQPQVASKASTTDWWSYLASIEHAADGYHHIEARLWQPDGQLVAISRQTVTVFA